MTTETAIPTITISGPQGCGKITLAQFLLKAVAQRAGIDHVATASMVGDFLKRGENMDFVDGQFPFKFKLRVEQTSDTQTAKPQPPYGPLTSTENLLPGDLVRSLVGLANKARCAGEILTVETPSDDYNPEEYDNYTRLWYQPKQFNQTFHGDVKEFAFVGRPDADGWITTPEGGYPENPVPGRRVEYEVEGFPFKLPPKPSHECIWHWGGSSGNITHWRLVPEEPEGAQPIDETPFLQAMINAPAIPLEQALAGQLRSAAAEFDRLLGECEQNGIRVTIRQGEGAFRLGSPDIVKVL